MNVTVAICTWNRATLLDQTLREMRKLRIPPGVEWEVLVVNNNSTDETDSVITRHENHLPIRRLFEPTPGKSHAANLAIREARGEIILWTDDDVLVDPEWMTAYCQASTHYPEAGFFGGTILPWFEGQPPRWLKNNWRPVESAFAVRDLGKERLKFSTDVLPYGANFAVRTSVQCKYAFDSELGPRPNADMRGEETTLLRQMLNDGLSGWWIPEARVRHYIPKARQTIRYLRSYYMGYGQYCAAADPHLSRRLLFGRPQWAWKKAIEAELKYRLGRLFCKPEHWISHIGDASRMWGYLGSYRNYK